MGRVCCAVEEEAGGGVMDGPTSILDRMVRAVEKVRERLLRSTAALEAAGIDYAVIGGHAVAAWVATVDETAVRNTADVDLLVRREDFDRVVVALESVGFISRHAAGVSFFLDGPEGKFRDAVHMIFANEKVRPEYEAAAPDPSAATSFARFRAVDLEALVIMKLTSFRDKDRTHLRDMLEIELIDESWLSRLPPPLAERLKQLIDTPEG
jgi:hypothetical protein